MAAEVGRVGGGWVGPDGPGGGVPGAIGGFDCFLDDLSFRADAGQNGLKWSELSIFWWCSTLDGPLFVVVVDAERGKASEVDRCGSGNKIGENTL